MLLYCLSGDLAKNKWKNLKDKFRKEVQKLLKEKSCAEGKLATSSWIFFDSMMFIKDVIIPGRTVGNLSLEDIPSTSHTTDLDIIGSDDDIISSDKYVFSWIIIIFKVEKSQKKIGRLGREAAGARGKKNGYFI